MNEQIKEYLEFYLALPEPPQFAVLISGDWGSGKSFFVKNFMEGRPDHKYLYISLYGVTTTKGIVDQIFEQLHPILASKGVKVARKIGASVLKGVLKIDLHHGDEIDLNSDFSKFEIPDFLTDADDRILIFDDLERCSMDIVTVLGYINQFVETNGNKVIIIANENEIEDAKSNDSQSEPDKVPRQKVINKYFRTKEKLIGKSFLVETEVAQAASTFFQSVRNERLKSYIASNRATIIDTYNDAQYNNLRHLKQTILELDRFFDILPDEAYKKPALLTDLVRAFVALSVELRASHRTEEIKTLYAGIAIGEPKEGTLLSVLKQKYTILKLPINISLWFEFFTLGTVKDKGRMVSSITNSEYFSDENRPPEITLWRWWYLNDDVFASTLDQAVQKFHGASIDNQYLLSHVVSILISLSEENLYDIPKPDILQIAKNNVDRLKNLGKLVVEVHNDISLGAYAGLGYNAKEIPEFKEYYEYLNKAAIDTLPSTYADQAKALMTELDTAPESFAEQIIIGSSSKNKYYDKPILASVDPNEFVQKYTRLSNYNKSLINYGLSKRYTHIQFWTDLKPELDWLRKVKDLLEQELSKPEYTVSRKLITGVADILKQAIVNFQTAIVPDA